MKCPICTSELNPVEQSCDSLLNEEQWKAVRLGDWFCLHCKPEEPHLKFIYFWNDVLVEDGK